jgi:hypothetical protein
MFKRARWVGTGAALGFGASLWIQHRIKAVAARYHPAGAADRARTLPGDLRDALREGRATMQQREAELRRTVWAADSRSAVVRPLPSPGSSTPRRTGPRRRAMRP